MKIYVINLKRREDRLITILKQFEHFNFSNYEIIEALDGQHHTHESLSTIYNSKVARRMQRDLSTGEICCVASHHIAYRKIIASSDSHSVIIEDDCPITQELIDYCNNDVPPPQIDIVMLGYYTSNENNSIVNSVPCGTYKPQSYQYQIMDICSETRVYFEKDPIENIYFKFDKKTTSVDFLHGTHCYCVSKSGATQLLKFNTPIFVEADNVWNYDTEMSVYGIRPMLVHVGRHWTESDLEIDRHAIQVSGYAPRLTRRLTDARFST
jgi:GR25 family glycosyltransferase involved in LPS biosynthesis